MSKSKRLNADKRSLVELRKQLVSYLEDLMRLDVGQTRDERLRNCIELMGNPRLKPVAIMHKKCVNLLTEELARLSDGDSMERLAANSVAKQYPELMKAQNASKRRAVKASGASMAVV